MNIPTPEQIRQARTEAGLNQTQAAKLVYRAIRTWQDYESGHTPIDMAVWELFLIKTSLP